MMHLLVGLGNVGKKYARNRHNIGFMAVDSVHSYYEFAPFRKKFHSDIAEGLINNERIYILKPRTYMNESGRAVAAFLRFYQIKVKNIIVFHDELDLLPGQIRVKQAGGFAGHNGLKSIGAHIGSEFRRVRMGIGHPGDKDEVTNHVLNDFAGSDTNWLDHTLDFLTKNIPKLISGDKLNES